MDFHYTGFEWIDFHDGANSIISFLRRAEDPTDFILFCCNFTPVPRQGYEFGVPEEGFYQEILNTDSEYFGGTNMGNGGVPLVAPRRQTQPPALDQRHAAAAGRGRLQKMLNRGKRP